MTMATRHDGRRADELRPVKIKRRFTQAAPGSVLYQCGRTTVLVTASIDASVPPWLTGKGQGWITAEYSMLPGSTSSRKPRERAGKVDGRTTEIQRLIGRSVRAVSDLAALGERTVTVDCDVLEADGGTRTASINAALIAVVDALRTLPDFPKDRYPLRETLAAVSVGLVDGRPVLDLDYREDAAAAVDMNVVLTGSGRFIELQGTGEEATFDEGELAALLKLARGGIRQLIAAQQQALGRAWPF